MGGPDIPVDLYVGLSGTYSMCDPGGGSPKLIFYKKGRFALSPEVGQAYLVVNTHDECVGHRIARGPRGVRTGSPSKQWEVGRGANLRPLRR